MTDVRVQIVPTRLSSTPFVPSGTAQRPTNQPSPTNETHDAASGVPAQVETVPEKKSKS